MGDAMSNSLPDTASPLLPVPPERGELAAGRSETVPQSKAHIDTFQHWLGEAFDSGIVAGAAHRGAHRDLSTSCCSDYGSPAVLNPSATWRWSQIGGYGRGELHPLSDVDLLILSRKKLPGRLGRKSRRTAHPLLWDVKLEVGHSVRTLEECLLEGLSGSDRCHQQSNRAC